MDDERARPGRMGPFVVCEGQCALMRAKDSCDQRRRTVDQPQGCALCLLGGVRRAYQPRMLPYWRWFNCFAPTKASAEGGRDEIGPPSASRPLLVLRHIQKIQGPLSLGTPTIGTAEVSS